MSSPLFGIIGPIMVGPSSSHTAGAVRLAHLARLIAGQSIRSVAFILYNSFAKTYRGHGTDKGLLAGMLGYAVDDDRIRDVFDLARNTELTWTFTPCFDNNHYSPNTVVFKMVLVDGKELTVTGHSTGGGSVYVSKINRYHVNLKGEQPTLIMFYKDQPGMIWRVTKVIAEFDINIATLQCSRDHKAGRAFMSICLDTPLPEDAVQQIDVLADTEYVRYIEPIPT